VARVTEQQDDVLDRTIAPFQGQSAL